MGLDRGAQRAGLIRSTYHCPIKTKTRTHPITVNVGLTRTIHSALRRLGLRQGIHVPAERLQQGELDAELRGVGGRRERVPDRVGAPGRHQDPNTEPQFREPRERLPHSGQHDAE